ncbi:MAG TPA: hypothetical protein VJ851_06345 [Jatrophihabitans sp.]|nr:hypothetical protein [Jatrophihabitans sp.]
MTVLPLTVIELTTICTALGQVLFEAELDSVDEVAATLNGAAVATVVSGALDSAVLVEAAVESDPSACAAAVPTNRLSMPTAPTAASPRTTRAPGTGRVLLIGITLQISPAVHVSVDVHQALIMVSH